MRTRSWILGLFAVVVAAFAAETWAGKPGGGGPAPSGTIYFRLDPVTWAMNSDGSGKESLPTGVGGVPSCALHGGHRWFLQLRDIEGETYPSGTTRREIFAVRQDGNASYAVQLTTQSDLELGPSEEVMGWKPGDGAVSWVARRWSGDAVVAGGIYSAAITFDGSGNAVGLAAQPTGPAIAVSLVAGTEGPFAGDPAPDLLRYDWAPSGTEVVYERFSAEELRTANLNGGDSLFLAGGYAKYPQWSPDNTRIAFNSSAGIDTMAPNGAGRKTIITSSNKYRVAWPKWSPTGSHITYYRYASPFTLGGEWDVYRATADGGSKTSLTGDIGGMPFPTAWR